MYKLQSNCSSQSEKMEYELPDEQAIFRPGRSWPTADVLVTLQVLVEKMIEMVFVAFIDYSKAFDSTIQVQMFQILSEMSCTKYIVALLEALYNITNYLTNGRHSSAFKIERGMRQGCIRSSNLFNLCNETVI